LVQLVVGSVAQALGIVLELEPGPYQAAGVLNGPPMLQSALHWGPWDPPIFIDIRRYVNYHNFCCTESLYLHKSSLLFGYREDARDITAHVMSKAKGEQFVALDMRARRRAEATETGMGTRELGVGDGRPYGEPDGEPDGEPGGRPYEGSSSGTDMCLTVAPASAGNTRPGSLKLRLSTEPHAVGAGRRPYWYGIGCRLRSAGHVNRTLV